MLHSTFQSQLFASEQDEAHWWDQHQDALADEFERAAAEGRLGHDTVARKTAPPSDPTAQ
ncbi:MAG TPA: hypothetical protein VMD58_02805 [Acidobacteriaceae bacterium]|nr:hypothetical protein [Acidobacteriaceae bacterium]